MLLFIKTVYVLINILIGVYDFSFYRLPNILLGLLIILYGFYASLYLEADVILSSLGISLIVLIFSFGLYAFKFIGAGDAKYLVVASLWVGFHNIFIFFLTFSLIGGLLGVVYLVLSTHMAWLSDRLWRQFQKLEGRYPFFAHIWSGSGTGPETKRENISSRVVPYGIAIAGGALITILYNP